VIENPILEPLYLFSGAMPPGELRHKFTLAEACGVDELLAPGHLAIGDIALEVSAAPGHAPNQMIVAAGGACFVADAVFAPDVLAKHGIPFMVDVDAWLRTLDEVARLDGRYVAFVPGHGPSVPAIGEWAGENAARLRKIRGLVAEAAGQSGDLGGVIEHCADRLGMAMGNLTTYLLAQTAVLACIASLQAAGEVKLNIQSNSLRLK
jgi:glyoxylase-like metal-dependent hydrolase (beta-lactamase superfamily II)